MNVSPATIVKLINERNETVNTEQFGQAIFSTHIAVENLAIKISNTMIDAIRSEMVFDTCNRNIGCRKPTNRLNHCLNCFSKYHGSLKNTTILR